MTMRVSFDFLISGFTVGCSLTKEGFSFAAFDSAFPSKSFLPSSQSLLVSLVCTLISYFGYRVWQASKYAGTVYSVPVPEQCEKGWKGEVRHNPSIKANDDHLIHCYCPANGRTLGVVHPHECADIDRMIALSTRAQESWSQTSFNQRRKVLRTLRHYILSHQDEIATAACLDSGKTKIDAALGEILVTLEKINWLLKFGEKALKPEKRPVSWPLMCYKKAELRYEPLGVVCACVSWNYPFHNLLGPIVSSIFAGNGIVVKGSEQTAWSSQYFISIIKGAVGACGHNPELVQSIICWPDVASHLTSHPDISHLTFIGSRPVAQNVAASASKSLTPLCIELGGKDAAIILDDEISNIQALSSVLLRGVFQSCGQNCIGIERIIPLPRVYPALVEHLQSRIKSMRLGSILDDLEPLDCGSMISDANFDRLEKLIDDAVVQGARCLAGGHRYHHPKHPHGHYFEPTLLVDVTSSMEIACTETFAPICMLLPASSLTSAISLANSTHFGLGGAVFGRDKRCLQRVAREMRSGMVSINDFAVYYMNQSLPFGGVKGSGYGRFAGNEGLRAVCNIKAVVDDRWPWLAQTRIPGVIDYPIKDADRGWKFVLGLMELGYGDTVWRAFGGMAKVLGF